MTRIIITDRNYLIPSMLAFIREAIIIEVRITIRAHQMSNWLIFHHSFLHEHGKWSSVKCFTLYWFV